MSSRLICVLSAFIIIFFAWVESDRCNLSSTEYNELQNFTNSIDIVGNFSVPTLEKSINIDIIGTFQNNLDINKTLIEIIGQVQ